jgi:hypothetical protein
MQPITADQLLATLGHHKGQAKGIHVRELAMQVYGELTVSGAQERAVRKLVTDLRLEGHPVCAHPTHGYFLAECQADLDHTINFLHARAMSSLVAVSRLKKISVHSVLAGIANAQSITESTDPATHEEQFNYE